MFARGTVARRPGINCVLFGSKVSLVFVTGGRAGHEEAVRAEGIRYAPQSLKFRVNRRLLEITSVKHIIYNDPPKQADLEQTVNTK